MPKINQTLKSGLTSYTIQKISKFPQQDVPKVYKELLRPLVADEDILNLLIQDQNIQKLKHRFEYQIQVKDKQEQKLAQIWHIGKKTLREVLTELNNNTEYNELVEDDYDDFGRKIRAKGYEYQHKMTGNLHRLKMTIIFRKAK